MSPSTRLIFNLLSWGFELISLQRSSNTQLILKSLKEVIQEKPASKKKIKVSYALVTSFFFSLPKIAKALFCPKEETLRKNS